MENKKWIFLCILGGSLMIIGCATGSIVLYEVIYELTIGYIGEELATIFSIILKIFGYIAAGGLFFTSSKNQVMYYLPKIL